MTIFSHTLRAMLIALLFAYFGAGAALAQTRAYVANSSFNNVSAIDTQTRSVDADKRRLRGELVLLYTFKLLTVKLPYLVSLRRWEVHHEFHSH